MATSDGAIPTRPFGRTGVNVSILALGGWHLGLPKTDKEVREGSWKPKSRDFH
jgi:aryl-alcohol dehydrogenase-like predicted oxidoreductase